MKYFLSLCFIVWSFALSGQENRTPKPVAPYSPVVQVGNTFYLSGQIPRVPETGELIRGDIRKATRQVMKNIGTVLKEHDLKFSHIVKCTVYLTDMDNYSAVNEVYATYFIRDHYPARVAVQVVRLPLDAEIEISCIAVKRSIDREIE